MSESPLSKFADIYYGKSPNGFRSEGETKYQIFGTGGVVGYATKALFEFDGVVIPRKGSLNNPSYAMGKYWVIDTAYAALPKEGFDAKWLYYQLLNYDLSKLNEATGVPSISRDWLYKTQFFESPLKDQKRIAQILTAIDKIIQNTETLIEKKRLIKKGLLSGLLEKHSAKSGEAIMLRELVYGVRGVSYTPHQLLTENTKDAFILLRSNNIKDNRINFDSIQLVPKGLVSDDQKAAPGDISVCMSNGSKSLVGKSAAFSGDIKDENVTIGAFCSIFKPKNRDDSLFLKYLFQSSLYQKHIDIVLAGSAINNLQNKVIEQLVIPYIGKTARHEIGEILEAVDVELNSIIQEYEKLKLQKKGLMQDLLTGQVRVN